MANPLMGMMGSGSVPSVMRGVAGVNPGVNKEAMQSIRRMMEMYKAAKNPQAVLQQMAQQNPMINGLMQIGSQNGGLQNAFYTMCKEQGVNPDDILNELKG